MSALPRKQRLLIPAVFITQLGNNVQLIGASFLVFKATDSTLSVGWLFVAVAIPQALLSWIFGRLSDHFDRRVLCIITDIGSALAALVLPVSLLLGHRGTEAAYVTTFLLAAAAALFLPASNALIKERVETRQLGKFNAHYEVASQAGMLFSGAVGGLLIQFFGGTPMFLFNAATFLASAFLIFRMGRPVATTAEMAIKQQAEQAEQTEHAGPTVRPLIRLVALFVVSSSVLTVVNAILLVLIVRRFHQGPALLGIVDALGGIGILLGAAHWGRLAHRDYKQLILFGFGGCALAELLMPVALWTLLPMIVVAGYTFSIGRIAVRTELMRAVSNERVGRLFGTAYGLGLAASVVATLVIATLTDRTSPVVGFIAVALLGGVPTLLIVASLYRKRGAPEPEPVLSSVS